MHSPSIWQRTQVRITRAAPWQLARSESVGAFTSHCREDVHDHPPSSLIQQPCPSHLGHPECGHLAARNPLREPPYGAPNETRTVPVDDVRLLAGDIPALLQLHTYRVLGTSEAETLLLACMKDLPQVILEHFNEFDAAQLPDTKKVHVDKILQEAVTDLLAILAGLPKSSFVGADGVPNEKFFVAVTACISCGTQTPLHSAFVRDTSLFKAAEEVAGAARGCRVRLPLRERVYRVLVTSADEFKLRAAFVCISVVALAVGSASLTAPQLIPSTICLGVVVACGFVATILASWCFFVQSVNRSAAVATRDRLQACVVGLVKVSFTDVESVGSAPPLAQLDHKVTRGASPRVALGSPYRIFQRDGGPHRVSDEGGTNDDGATHLPAKRLASRSNVCAWCTAGAPLLPLVTRHSPNPTKMPPQQQARVNRTPITPSDDFDDDDNGNGVTLKSMDQNVLPFAVDNDCCNAVCPPDTSSSISAPSP
jgi:multidrug transporter EmrE-like cation transporter